MRSQTAAGATPLVGMISSRASPFNREGRSIVKADRFKACDINGLRMLWSFRSDAECRPDFCCSRPVAGLRRRDTGQPGRALARGHSSPDWGTAGARHGGTAQAMIAP
jgi:hypothetical protein